MSKEMSKERLRLESVKSTIKLIKEYVVADTHYFETLALATELILNNGHWFMEQAERVQELEEDIDRLNRALHYQLSQENIKNEQIRRLDIKNRKYREALQEIIESTMTIKDYLDHSIHAEMTAMKALEGDNNE